MTKSNAPADAATQETNEDLPKTGVKERPLTRQMREMQEKLASFAAPEDEAQDASEAQQPEPTSEEETWKKRYGDVRKHAQKIENDAKKEITKLKDQMQQLESAAKQPMPQTQEEFEAWSQKYPDIVKFIEIIADKKAGERATKLQEQLGEVTQKLTETEKDKAKATLKSLVPDIDTVVKSPEFTAWFEDQPLFVQEILDSSDDPSEVAYYVGLYKNTGKKPVKTDKRDVLSTPIKGSGSTPNPSASNYSFSTSQIEAESRRNPNWFSQNEDAINLARREGKILDDTSKSNYVNMI